MKSFSFFVDQRTETGSVRQLMSINESAICMSSFGVIDSPEGKKLTFTMDVNRSFYNEEAIMVDHVDSNNKKKGASSVQVVGKTNGLYVTVVDVRDVRRLFRFMNDSALGVIDEEDERSFNDEVREMMY
jgi:hypothetical protein